MFLENSANIADRLRLRQYESYFLAPRFEVFAVVFEAAGLRAAGFFAAGLLAAAFFTGAFFTAGFLAAGFLAAGRFAAGFLAAAFFTGAFFTAAFLAGVFGLVAVVRLLAPRVVPLSLRPARSIL